MGYDAEVADMVHYENVAFLSPKNYFGLMT